MICPEGVQLQHELIEKETEDNPKSGKNIPAEGSGLGLSTFRNPKSLKKSLTNFFRNQLRSTKSNDGDRPSGSQDKFEEKEVSPEQKWQSLGKIFRRQSFVDHWNKSPNPQGESSSHSKRFGVKKVLSSYFGKNQKSPKGESDK